MRVRIYMYGSINRNKLAEQTVYYVRNNGAEIVAAVRYTCYSAKREQ